MSKSILSNGTGQNDIDKKTDLNEPLQEKLSLTGKVSWVRLLLMDTFIFIFIFIYQFQQKPTMNTSMISNGHDENEIDQDIDLNEPSRDKINTSMDSQNRMVSHYVLFLWKLTFFCIDQSQCNW